MGISVDGDYCDYSSQKIPTAARWLDLDLLSCADIGEAVKLAYPERSEGSDCSPREGCGDGVHALFGVFLLCKTR